ncbi:hypothetical protein [Clostridium tagluense]|uniref:hypothetical protein n=1 Tax=Clostridium tagluense TaxID=360422 RepID=UPI001CF149B2|nr:hypothetical protein [Clostridium tagluense]MCB2300419.1 hypothetical protein [Clostridium tagluense]
MNINAKRKKEIVSFLMKLTGACWAINDLKDIILNAPINEPMWKVFWNEDKSVEDIAYYGELDTLLFELVSECHDKNLEDNFKEALLDEEIQFISYGYNKKIKEMKKDLEIYKLKEEMRKKHLNNFYKTLKILNNKTAESHFYKLDIEGTYDSFFTPNWFDTDYNTLNKKITEKELKKIMSDNDNNEDVEIFYTMYQSQLEDVVTVSELAEIYKKDTSTIRKAIDREIKAGNLIEGEDCRKSVQAWLIRKNAIPKLKLK